MSSTLRAVKGVHFVSVDFPNKTATVKGKKGVVSASDLVEALEITGSYKGIPISKPVIMVLKIKGLNSSIDARKIRKILAKVKGVTSVKTSVSRKAAKVIGTKGVLKRENLIKALENSRRYSATTTSAYKTIRLRVAGMT